MSGSAADEHRRQRLLRAAQEVFAEVGYGAATVRAICRQAGVNVALVKYYFGDKLELYEEVLQSLLRETQLDEVMSLFESDLAPEAILRGVVRARLKAVLRHERAAWHLRLIAHELSHPSPALLRVMDGVRRLVQPRIFGLVARLLGCDEADERVRLCCASILGQMLFYLLAALASGLRLSEAECERVADHVADFSLAALRAMAEPR